MILIVFIQLKSVLKKQKTIRIPLQRISFDYIHKRTCKSLGFLFAEWNSVLFFPSIRITEYSEFIYMQQYACAIKHHLQKLSFLFYQTHGNFVVYICSYYFFFIPLDK